MVYVINYVELILDVMCAVMVSCTHINKKTKNKSTVLLLSLITPR